MVDDSKGFSANYSEYDMEEGVLWRKYRIDGQEAREILAHREIHDYQDVGDSLRAYLDLDPHEALASQDPILKALAIIDQRIGKRTLRKLTIRGNEHSLVRVFYCLRCPEARGRTHGKVAV